MPIPADIGGSWVFARREFPELDVETDNVPGWILVVVGHERSPILAFVARGVVPRSLAFAGCRRAVFGRVGPWGCMLISCCEIDAETLHEDGGDDIGGFQN